MHDARHYWAVAGGIVIYAYFAGFVFLRYFYAYFGWSVTNMDIPVLDVFPFAINVVARGIALGPKLTCLAALVVLVVLGRRRPWLGARLPVVIGVLAFVGLHWVAAASGLAIAAEELRQTAGGPPRGMFGYVAETFTPVDFVLVASEAEGAAGARAAACQRANRAGRLRLVKQTSRSYFTVALPADTSARPFLACDFRTDSVRLAATPVRQLP